MRRLAGQQPLDVRDVRVQIIRMGDVLKRHALQDFVVIAQHLTERVIDLNPTAVETDDGGADGRVVKRRPEQPLLDAHCPLGEDAPGHVMAFGDQIRNFVSRP